MQEIYHLPKELIEQIANHLDKHFPQEACGLLAGRDHLFQVWVPIHNSLESPYRYRMDPEQQLRAFLEFEKNQLELLGIVHSHPSGGDSPSQTDLKEAYYPEAVYFIFYRSKEEWDYNAYHIDQNGFYKVEIHVIE